MAVMVCPACGGSNASAVMGTVNEVAAVHRRHDHVDRPTNIVGFCPTCGGSGMVGTPNPVTGGASETSPY